MLAQSYPNCVIIAHAEVVAGNYSSAAYGCEIFNSTYLLYYELAVCDHFVKKSCSGNIGYLVFYPA
jgi:hypothetical protein